MEEFSGAGLGFHVTDQVHDVLGLRLAAGGHQVLGRRAKVLHAGLAAAAGGRVGASPNAPSVARGA